MDFWGKAKNGSYIKTSAMTESLVKLSQKCIKSGKALEAFRKKDNFSHRYCNTVSFLLNRISHATHANEQTVVALLTLEFITSVVGLRLHIAS